MKTRTALTTLIAAVFSLTAWAGTGSTVKVDTEKSQVVWKAKKVGGAHDGHVGIAEGHLVFNGDQLTGGEFVIDMQSITVADIKDEKMNAKLQGHLESDDFFSVATYPKASLVITGAEKTGDKTYMVSGNLTIKGATHPTKFEATIEHGEKLSANAVIEVDRTLYDVRYGSKKFFDNLGDKFIYDNFTLEVSLSGK